MTRQQENAELSDKKSVSLDEYRVLVNQERKAASEKRSANRNGKYNAIRTNYDGISFDSKGECERYKQLKYLESIGEILNLRLKIVHKLICNDVHICSYESDFEYDEKDGTHIVEDYKGFRTKEFKIKSKLMLALKGISVLETGVKSDAKKGGFNGRKS
jgi:hypothetical protein